MGKKTTPSNSNVAKKLEAMRKAANKKAAPSAKEANKTPSKVVKKRKPLKKETENKSIDYESYPKTKTVLMWQKMVQDNLDAYISSISGNGIRCV